MTPAATAFSNELMGHAACLELANLGPVGAWDYGQGIRRAKDQSFYYALSREDFSPFGTNHPLALRSRLLDPTRELKIHVFPVFLVTAFPVLQDWQWTIADTQLATSLPEALYENATLKCDNGWSGFTHVGQLTHWVVELGNGLSWWASRETPVPADHSTTALEQEALIDLFLSADILGPQGRLREWQDFMKRYEWGQWSGLNFSIRTKAPVLTAQQELAHAGLQVSIEKDNLVSCFGLSMLADDVDRIMKTLHSHQG